MHFSALTYTVIITFTFANLALAISDAEWAAYKRKYGKSYETKLEDWIRRELLADNIEEAELFNAANSAKLGYKIGINQFSDLTKREMIRLGRTKPAAPHKNTLSAEQYLAELLKRRGSNEIALARQLDWTPSRVTRVKDQGLCKSSWPFVATGLIEGQLSPRSRKDLIELSEQNLIDCVANSSGCISGSIESAFSVSSRGLEPEASYPFFANKSSCKFNPSKSVISTSSDFVVLPQDEESIKRVVAKFGPVAAVIQASKQFVKYKSGVFQNAETQGKKTDCSKVNHGVLIVGYGTDARYGDYWIVKNSWGTSWGNAGYAKLARNKQNESGIACSALIPIMQ